jgi:hypothetical protein
MSGIRSLESRVFRSRSFRAVNSGDLVSSPVLAAFRSLTQVRGLSPVTSSSHWNESLGSSAAADTASASDSDTVRVRDIRGLRRGVVCRDRLWGRAGGDEAVPCPAEAAVLC